MRYITFLLLLLSLASVVYAGPDDRWVPAESVEEGNVESVGVQTVESTAQSFDGIALILAVGAFSWVYIIYRDLKGKRRK